MEILEAGEARVAIDHDRGGRLSSLVVAGHELLVSDTDGLPGSFGWGSFPMAPYAGRIRRGRFRHDGRDVDLPLDLPPHAIHGTTHDRAWQRTGPGRLRAPLGEAWPWPGEVRQEVVLEARSLTLRLTVASDHGSMPATAGWHPWFRRRIGGADVEIDLRAQGMWRRDADGIPDGTIVDVPPGPWDDCFRRPEWPVRLRWPGILVLAIDADVDHVVVYDEQPHAVCVEPQSAPPDAHNSGVDLAWVTPESPLAVETRWTWSLEPGRPV